LGHGSAGGDGGSRSGSGGHELPRYQIEKPCPKRHGPWQRSAAL
jgi:hypothetical protein